MSKCGWFAFYKIRIENLVEHDDPDAEMIARDVLDSDSIIGVADWPDDFELVRLERDLS